jgi:hypothetical protein
LPERELESLRAALDFILEAARAEHRAAGSAGSSRNAVNYTELHSRLEIEGNVKTIVKRVRRWREAEICGEILDALGIGWDLGFARLGVDRSDVEAPTVTDEQVGAVLEMLATHRQAQPKPRRMRRNERDAVPGTLNAILAIAHIEHSGQHARPETVARLFGTASRFTDRVNGWRNSGVWEPILVVLGITWDFSLGGSQPRGSGSPSEADPATVDAPGSERTQQAPVHDVQEGSATRDRPRPQAGAGTLQRGLQWGSGRARVLQTVAEADHPVVGRRGQARRRPEHQYREGPPRRPRGGRAGAAAGGRTPRPRPSAPPLPNR